MCKWKRCNAETIVVVGTDVFGLTLYQGLDMRTRIFIEYHNIYSIESFQQELVLMTGFKHYQPFSYQAYIHHSLTL